MSLELLNKKGVCCSLYVSYPKYRNHLSLEIFQMQVSGDDRNILRGPGLNLMTEELKRISSAESRGRSALNSRTLPLDLQVGLHFCPITGLSALIADVDSAKEEFNTAVDDFLTNFEEHVENARKRWTDVVEQQTDMSDEARKRMLDYGLSQLPMTPPHKSQFIMSMLSVELSVPGQPSLQDIDAAEAVAAQEAASRVREDAVKRLSAVSDGFVDACRSELYQRVAKFCSGMQSLIKVGKPINKRTVTRIDGFITGIRQLNFLKDEQLDKILGKLQAVCFPDGMPTSSDDMSGVKDDDAVSAVKDTIDEITSMLQFSVAYAREEDNSMEKLREEVESEEVKEQKEPAPAPGLVFI